jgi:hypothetical protein
MTLSRWILAGALAATAGAAAPAHAQSAAEMRKLIEARMHVSGTIDIEPDGSVSAHAIEDAADVPREVRGLIAQAAGTWRFEPIIQDGAAVPARATMHLKIVAEQVPDSEAIRLRLASAHFGKAPETPVESIRQARNAPPRYPEEPLSSGASATAYTVLKLDPDGAVADAFVERVDLYRASTGRQMRDWREAFSEAALRAASRWRFDLSGKARDDARLGMLTVRVPVNFEINGGPERDGPWQPYIPGPEVSAPWLDEMVDAASADTFAGNGPRRVGAGHTLLTPLDPHG